MIVGSFELAGVVTVILKQTDAGFEVLELRHDDADSEVWKFENRNRAMDQFKHVIQYELNFQN